MVQEKAAAEIPLPYLQGLLKSPDYLLSDAISCFSVSFSTQRALRHMQKRFPIFIFKDVVETGVFLVKMSCSP